jgi:hypothetical protein
MAKKPSAKSAIESIVLSYKICAEGVRRLEENRKAGLIQAFESVGWHEEALAVSERGVPNEVHAAPALFATLFAAFSHFEVKVILNNWLEPNTFFFSWGGYFPHCLEELGGKARKFK